MAKEIEIPEGYDAKIVGNKVVLEPKESEDERIRKELLSFLKEGYPYHCPGSIGRQEWLAYLEKQKEHYSPLCKTIKDKIREYIANHFITDAVVKTDVRSIVKAMEEGVRLSKEEQKPAEYIYITQKILDYIDKNSRKYENKRPILGDVWTVTKKYTFPNVFNGKPKPVVEVEKNGFGWMCLPEEIVEVKNGQKKLTEMDNEEIELSDFESELFSAFSDAWQQYLHGEEVDVAQWAKEHSAQLLNAAKQELKPTEWSEEDENYLEEIIDDLMFCKKNRKSCTKDLIEDCIDWLNRHLKKL